MIRPARRRLRILILSGTLVLLAASCTSSGDELGAVRPFSEVQASAYSFEMDPNAPGRGIFHVTTTIPMICSITWGETEELGNQNNSLSMDGTGIEQHDVVLPGGEAGTRYFFTVQGADAQGNLYRSELLTVTIPDTGSAVLPQGAEDFELSDEGGPSPGAGRATETEAVGENLALGATVTEVSSQFGDAFAAENAIDDDLSTEWSTRGDGDDAFLELDLGEPRRIAGVAFLTRSMADTTAITSTYTVTVDGRRFGPFDAGNARASIPSDLGDVTGRIVRFDVDRSSGGNTGALELRVLAPS